MRGGSYYREQTFEGGWRKIRKYIQRQGIAAVIWRGLELSIARTIKDSRNDGPVEKLEQTVKRLGTPVERVESLNSPEALEVIARYRADLAIVGGTRILRVRCLEQFPMGVMNSHHGLLPKYRGNYCNRWALLNGDKCGVSIYLLDAGLDTGPILCTETIEPLPEESLVELDERLTKLGADLVARTAKRYLAGRLAPRTQSLDEGAQYPFMSARSILKLYWKRYFVKLTPQEKIAPAEREVYSD